MVYYNTMNKPLIDLSLKGALATAQLALQDLKAREGSLNAEITKLEAIRDIISADIIEVQLDIDCIEAKI